MTPGWQVNGIGWHEAGQGDPVLLLHGMPGSAFSWLPQMEGLPGRKIAWDMPGYGDSTHRPDLVSPAAMAAFLAERMDDTLGLGGGCHVVGLSLGAMIAMELALLQPRLVWSLVLLDTSPKFGLDGTSKAEDFVTSVETPFRNGTSLEDLCHSILTDLVGPDCPEHVFDAALAAMLRVTPEGLVHAARLIGNHDALERLSGIAAPTLVMTGQYDTATPPAYGRMIASRILGSRFVEAPGAGHLSNLENTSFVNDAIAGAIAATRSLLADQTRR